MAKRSITGEYRLFWNDEPFAFGKLKITLDKEDWDSNAIYPAEDISVTFRLDQNGAMPLGFELWVNENSANGSKYTVTEYSNDNSDGNSWNFILPAGAGAIDIQTLRDSAI